MADFRTSEHLSGLDSSDLVPRSKIGQRKDRNRSWEQDEINSNKAFAALDTKVSSRSPLLTPLSFPMNVRPSAILVASLGNPGPLKSTRHSAGHILLSALATSLRAPAFSRSKPHANGQLTSASLGSTSLTIWQSPTLMNVSGPALLKAWRAFVSENQGDAAGLVILHDEMETLPGKLKVRKGLQGSVKGHNGLKSIVGSFRSASAEKESRIIRVGIGIGRPTTGSRERADVSEYVLGKCSGDEMAKIEGLAEELEQILEREGQRISNLD